MKRWLSVALVATTFVCFNAESSRADLVSWWKAEGNALDSLGGNDGAPHGLQYGTGIKGNSFLFDGVSSGINVPDNENLRITGSLTIDAWIYPTAFPAEMGIIVFRGDNRGGADPYYLTLRQNGEIWFLITSLDNATLLTTPAITLNRWIHVVATLDGTTGLMRIYENGTIVAETTTTVRPFRDLDPNEGPGVGIGNHPNYPNTPHNFPFAGRIDEVKVFNSVEPPPTLWLQNQSNRAISRLNVDKNRFIGSTSLSPILPANWRIAASADFDRDGWNDIVAQNEGTRAVSILFVNGNRFRSSVPVNPTLPPDWKVMGAGDIDADGKPDLIVQNPVTQQIAALLMDVTTIRSSKSFSRKLLAGWTIVGAADFSGDGLTDLVVQNVSTRQVSIITLNGTAVTGSVSVLPTLPADWSIGAVGDFNEDGKPDLVAQNSANLRISVLTMLDMNITASIPLTPDPLPGWALVGPR